MLVFIYTYDIIMCGLVNRLNIESLILIMITLGGTVDIIVWVSRNVGISPYF